MNRLFVLFTFSTKVRLVYNLMYRHYTPLRSIICAVGVKLGIFPVDVGSTHREQNQSMMFSRLFIEVSPNVDTELEREKHHQFTLLDICIGMLSKDPNNMTECLRAIFRMNKQKRKKRKRLHFQSQSVLENC